MCVREKGDGGFASPVYTLFSSSVLREGQIQEELPNIRERPAWNLPSRDTRKEWSESITAS